MAPRIAIITALMAGLITDLAFHGGVRGVGLMIVASGIAAAMVTARSVHGAGGRMWLAAAVLLAAGCTVRASPWVELSLVAVSGVCFTVAAGSERKASSFNASWTSLVVGVIDCVIPAIAVPQWLTRGARNQVPRGIRAVRAVALAALVIAILAGLLASADPVFANLVHVDANDALVHVALVASGTLMAGWLVLRGLIGPREQVKSLRTPLAATDVILVLGAVATLFTVFVTVQVATAAGVGVSTLRSRGITYSDYARSGYFQLMGVIAVVVLLLPWCQAAVTTAGARVRRAVSGLSLFVLALSAGILGVALQRLALYDDAFGLTMLRLTSQAGAYFMAILLLLLAILVLGFRRHQRWFPAATMIALIVGVAVFAAVNPEAIVASYNLARSGRVPLDREYLMTLSTAC